MKKIFVITLFLIFAQTGNTSETSDFGGMLGAALCADAGNQNIISACYWEGSIAGTFLDGKYNVCDASYALLDKVKNRIKKNELHEYLTSAGEYRAGQIAASVCTVNGALSLEEGRGYFTLARDYFLASEGNIVQSQEGGTHVSSKEDAILKVVVDIVRAIAIEILNKNGERISYELSPERLKEQLEQWLVNPKESLCRGELTSGDIGGILGRIVSCN